jgi:pre-mRNA-processing factor 19
MFCAISGEPPQDPVFSAKSGNVYERRLILKYITDNGTDPITGEKLDESDLITVKASELNLRSVKLNSPYYSDPKAAPPRPPTQSSVPALLHTFQNEWDALVLETFALKQQYNSTRQELSYALYAQDAASRVVARLIRERDAARE